MTFLVAMTALSLVALLPSTNSQPYSDASIKNFTDKANTTAALSKLFQLDLIDAPSSLGGRTLFEGGQMVEPLLEKILKVEGTDFRVLFYVGCGGKGLNARAAIYKSASYKEIIERRIVLDIVEIPSSDGSHGKDSYFDEIQIADSKKSQERNESKETIAFIYPKLKSLSNVTYSYLLDSDFCSKLGLLKNSLSTGTDLEKGKNWFLIQTHLTKRFSSLVKPNTKLVVEAAFGDGFEGDRPAPVPYALTAHLNSLDVPIDHLDNVLGVSQGGLPTKTWTLYKEDGGKTTVVLIIRKPRNVIQLYPRQSTVTANAELKANVIQCGLQGFFDAIRKVAGADAQGLIATLIA